MNEISDYEMIFLKEAIDNLTLAISKSPSDYDSYYKRGFTYYLMKNYQSALDDMTKSIQLNPSNDYRRMIRAMIEKEMIDSQNNNK